jgi:hypothetical protein
MAASSRLKREPYAFRERWTIIIPRGKKMLIRVQIDIHNEDF